MGNCCSIFSSICRLKRTTGHEDEWPHQNPGSGQATRSSKLTEKPPPPPLPSLSSTEEHADASGPSGTGAAAHDVMRQNQMSAPVVGAQAATPRTVNKLRSKLPANSPMEGNAPQFKTKKGRRFRKLTFSGSSSALSNSDEPQKGDKEIELSRNVPVHGYEEEDPPRQYTSRGTLEAQSSFGADWANDELSTSGLLKTRKRSSELDEGHHLDMPIANDPPIGRGRRYLPEESAAFTIANSLTQDSNTTADQEPSSRARHEVPSQADKAMKASTPSTNPPRTRRGGLTKGIRKQVSKPFSKLRMKSPTTQQDIVDAGGQHTTARGLADSVGDSEQLQAPPVLNPGTEKALNLFKDKANYPISESFANQMFAEEAKRLE
ncbi:uncharacterized protein LOC135822909 [Sycon ciliatum]|uniref:uncharacterized protein LOC135822909 n=1 Tax=Sycon ciliatum TaxID=27933 RepID=UPI0031F65105